MTDNPSWTLDMDTISTPYYARSGKYLWPWGHLCIYQVRKHWNQIVCKRTQPWTGVLEYACQTSSELSVYAVIQEGFISSVELQVVGRAKPKSSRETNPKSRGTTENLNNFELLLLEIREDQTWHLKWRRSIVR